MRLGFEVQKQASHSRARAGKFSTLHNQGIETPLFMPVGTQATVRGQTIDTLAASGSKILLANTYHLLLKPGPEVFERAGGIQKFMRWNGSVLTDSGGFQIFSLPGHREMKEEGAEFTTFVGGRRILLSPEKSIEMQRSIGSDIMMVLDQCIPSTAGHAEAEAAMNLTHRWAKRSLAARGDSPQSLFGIVQGACFEDLRKQSADFLTSLEFDGFAIGGLAVGESKAQREDFTELTAALLPPDRPRYLMGVGTPIDLLEAVHRGVDLFDCILPNSLAQFGVAFTSKGKVELRRTIYRFADDVLDSACGCPTCATYSRAYLHHLVKAKEVLAWHLIGMHNLYFYHGLMREVRSHILRDAFAEYYRTKREDLVRSDEENPKKVPRIRKSKTERQASRERLGKYEICRSAAGFASVRETVTGEVMHPLIEPCEEARLLYVEQSRFLERAGADELILWDVGLGAAINAMTTLRAFEGLEEKKFLRIESFENDLDSLKLALRNSALFPHLWHSAPTKILSDRNWNSPTAEWRLFEGDFLERMADARVPDLIFFDPFSAKVDGPLWQPEAFRQIREKCGDHPVELYTYSSSTAVRSALLAAGFYVARGRGTGNKLETTIALTPSAAVRRPELSFLGKEFLDRLSRSGARRPELDAAILAHPQFAEALPC